MSDIKDLNGYEWGKEYPTNGKRPDLPDDLEIEGLTPCLWSKCTVSTMWWNMVRSFRITDPRYKPDEVVSESDWFDLEEMPTVGTQVEVYIKQMNYWSKVKVLAVDGEYIVWRNGSDNKSYIGTHKDNIRPIDRHKEKVIEVACKVQIEIGKSLFESLYDAGMLVLPTK